MSKKDDFTPDVPMDGTLLAELEYGRKAISVMLSNGKTDIIRFCKQAQRLDLYDASRLKRYKQANNIRNAAVEISNYFGIIDMLLQNIECDMHDIWEQRKLYQLDYLNFISKQQEKELRAADAERKRADYEKKKAEQSAINQ